MDFTGGDFTGFGSSTPASSPFGAPAAPSPFGATQFGQQPGAFGATGAAAPAFGSTAPPQFGTPTAASGFGTNTAFGAPMPATSQFGGFGTTSSSPFGASAPSAFGGTSAYGQQSAPTFWQPAAGGATFGAKPGTQSAPFQRVLDSDPASQGANKQYLMSVSAMPQYHTKSVEELRWEDYQTPRAFGAAQTPGAFGSAATPAFGTAPMPGGFGTPGTPAFGTQGGAFSAGGFGAIASTPAFGASAPSAFGGTSAFGQQYAPTFGQPAAGGATFGAMPGTQSAPFQKVFDIDPASQGANKQYLMSVSAMPQYNTKSVEELRWEDYQVFLGIIHYAR